MNKRQRKKHQRKQQRHAQTTEEWLMRFKEPVTCCIQAFTVVIDNISEAFQAMSDRLAAQRRIKSPHVKPQASLTRWL